MAGGSIAVSITSPTGGAVSGVQTVTATASAGQGVAGVQFKVDGQNLGAEDTSAPFSVSWDTRCRAERLAHADGGRPRHGRKHRELRAGRGHREQCRRLCGRAPGRVRLRRRAARRSPLSTRPATTGPQRSRVRAGRSPAATAARFRLNGTSSEVDRPRSGRSTRRGSRSRPGSTSRRASSTPAVVGTWTSQGGPMIWVDHMTGHYRLTLGTAS